MTLSATIADDAMLTKPDEVEGMTASFIAGLDRSRLGSFAVPLDVLFANDVANRLFILTDGGSELYEDAIARLTSALFASDTDNRDVTAEMVFWWSVTDDPFMRIRRVQHLIDSFQEGIEKLLVVYENPDKHEYFDAGIWDVAFIERCIAGDVDVELALTLMASSGGRL